MVRKAGTGEKGERKQDQELGQCHTSRDVVRKVPREQWRGVVCRNLQYPLGLQTPDNLSTES